MSEAARRSLEELQASILFASDFPKRITYTPAIPSGASARGRLDDQRARVASKCFEALFSNFIAFIADWQGIRAEPQLLVPRGGCSGGFEGFLRATRGANISAAGGRGEGHAAMDWACPDVG